MSTNQNPVDDLIEIGKQNQVLLGKIAASQEMILEVEQDRKTIQNREFVWQIVKYGIFIILIFISFSFTQNMVEGLTSNMLGGGGQQNIDIEQLLQGGNVNNLLKNIQ